MPGTPLSSCSPRSVKAMFDPTTRSLTVEETRISPGRARADDVCADVDGESGDVVAADFYLTGVDTGTDVDVRDAERVTDSDCAFDRSPGTLERGEKTVAPGVDLTAPEAFDLGADVLIVAVEHVAPTSVAELRGAVRGTDDVGEQHGGEHSVGAGTASDTGQELFDLVEHRPGVADPIDVINTGQLHVSRSVDVFGEIAAMFHTEHTQIRPV